VAAVLETLRPRSLATWRLGDPAQDGEPPSVLLQRDFSERAVV